MILSYKGFQVAREKLPVLIQDVKNSGTYKMMTKQGLKLAEESYNYAKALIDRSPKK